MACPAELNNPFAFKANYNCVMRSQRIGLLVAAILIFAVIVFGYLSMIPQVISFSPEDGASGLLENSGIQIEFSRSMDAESVEQAFNLDPQLVGDFTWNDNLLIFTPSETWPSGASITVSLSSQAQSNQGLSLSEELQWSFTTEQTLLAYLYPSEGPADIYAIDIDSGKMLRLTNSMGILDFDVSTDGNILYYSVVNNLGGSDLYQLDRSLDSTKMILDCGVLLCRNPQLHPSQATLAYERYSNMSQTNNVASQVWIIPDIFNPQPEALDEHGNTTLPLWSSTGWLSYYDLDLNKYVFLDHDSGERMTFENQTGNPGAWSPSGDIFIAPELIAVQPTPPPTNSDLNEEPTLTPTNDLEGLLPSHLMMYDLSTGEVTDLTRDASLEDATPALSPTGRLLAFARKYIDQSRWSPGRQLWLMSPDSGEAIMLTQTFNYTHSSFVWHPGGQTIAFVRFNQLVLTDPPELWVINRDGRNAMQLIIGGFAPQWIP